MNVRAHRQIGFFVWTSVAIVGVSMFARLPKVSVERAAGAVWASLMGQDQTFRLVDHSGVLQVGDPVFVRTTNGKLDAAWKQIAHVSGREEGEFLAAWHGNSSPSSFRFVMHRQSGSLQSIMTAMLPPEKQERIQRRLKAAMAQHGDEIAASLVPLVRESFERSLPVVEAELRASLRRHKTEIDLFTQSWNDKIIQQRLIPISKQEILPIVRHHAQPEVEAIGKELWDRASLWRFGWRALYDKTPLPQQDLVREEWDRFVEGEAIPVFESHTDELVASLQRILRDVAANPGVQQEFREMAAETVDDPKAKVLFRQILREVLVENPALRETWREVWMSAPAKARLRRIGDQVEPIVREIGDELFGTRETGIDPGFARVLRGQILGKDRRWIEAIPSEQSPTGDRSRIEVASAGNSLPYPVVYLATEDR